VSEIIHVTCLKEIIGLAYTDPSVFATVAILPEFALNCRGFAMAKEIARTVKKTD